MQKDISALLTLLKVVLQFALVLFTVGVIVGVWIAYRFGLCV